jgi:four helix bundle protein
MRDYKKLKVWEEGMSLCVEVYNILKTFPKEEIYSLTSQIRRSAISIPSNIAEGAGRNSGKELHNFLGIANGSCCELETQMILAYKLNYITENSLNLFLDKTDHIQKMTFNLRKSLNV